jgi:hypothetical protein
VTTALNLITRSLRLINQPGRGATLAPEDLTGAFEALQEILDSEAVSKQFVPGIRRHFFNFIGGKAIYSYGANPGDDLDSSQFGNIYGDPAPVKIEAAYVRAASSITDNELVDEYRFHNVGNWVVDPLAVLANNIYSVESPGAPTSSTQAFAAPAPVLGETYTLRIIAQVQAGQAIINFRESAVNFDQFIIDSSGTYEFDFVWTQAPVLPDIEIAALGPADFQLSLVSIIPRGLERLSLPDGQGSDYNMVQMDQTHYNRQFTKGNLGRPYHYLYTRAANGEGQLRFDNRGVTGDILVMDVLVNSVSVNEVNDEMRINPQMVKWLRYALADNVAGDYGKELSFRQVSIMDDAWNMLAASNRRQNMLGVDRGIRQRQRFDINRGDP